VGKQEYEVTVTIQHSNRRNLLLSSVALLFTNVTTGCSVPYSGSLPSTATDAEFPDLRVITGYEYFTPDEVAAVDALVDRLIPPDPQTPGGKDAGVTVYIDRQLAGPFGMNEGLYISAPFADGLTGQGPQSPLTPAQRYRQSLAGLDHYCRSATLSKSFADLTTADQDRIITLMEQGTLNLQGPNSKVFFALLLKNAKEGFFADPLYGGNKDMVSWKMLGFPGAHYDYREWVDKHNQRIPLEAVSIGEHPDWVVKS
jgi:gluconate 2-dehydrogenase gamma chain